MKKIKRFLGIVVLLAIFVYLIGPKPDKPEMSTDLPSIPASIGNIEDFVKKNDEGLKIKPDNDSRIIWANDSVKQRTDYCILYLHGFSASWYEGNPTHIEVAKKFGANLYLPRLASHGIVTEDALLDMTPDRLWESAKKALMVARKLGKKVILMSTSTGGTLSLQLAADFPEYIAGLILYSPNIRINEAGTFILSKPWGLQIARKIVGGDYRITNDDFSSTDCKYWNCKYRMEAVVYLQQLVDVTMNKETFEKVTAPVFVGYYYKDEDHQDPTVKVSSILKMYDQLGTSPDKKRKVAFPDAGTHTIACKLTSGSVKEVIAETDKFLEEILKLTPVN